MNLDEKWGVSCPPEIVTLPFCTKLMLSRTAASK